jgi:hypothetical protein
MIRYYINGKDIEQYGVYVVGQSGMLSPLRAKERESVSLSNAHGRIYDTTKTYYEERVIELELAFLHDSMAGVDLLRALRAAFSGITRIERRNGYEVLYFDVLWDSYANESFWDWNAGTINIVLKEPNPVKHVYKVVGNYSFTTADKSEGTQDLLLISRGDGTYVEVRAGTHTHTYTDGYTSHIVLISGNIENVTISTSHILLYTILQ